MMMLLFVVASQKRDGKIYFIMGKEAFSSRQNASKSVQTLDFSPPLEIAIHYSILHFSNNNIHGSINDDEFIKDARRFLKIYPRETSRREVKLWSGLSRYDIVMNFAVSQGRRKKEIVRSFVIILVHINRVVVRDIDTSSSSFCKTGILACLDGYMNIAMEHTEVRTPTPRTIVGEDFHLSKHKHRLSSFLVKATSF